MNFLNFSALGFAAVIPLVVLLYFLKLKRTEQIIASTLLWQSALEDLRVNSPFQRLQKNLLLFLQILLLVLAILALARPFMAAKGYQGQNFVLLLDISASMQVCDAGGTTRLAQAQKRALDLVADMSRDDKMMIVAFARQARIVQGFTTTKRLLIKAIKSLQAQDTATHIRDALLIARSIVQRSQNAEVYVITDGGVGPLTDLPLGRVRMRQGAKIQAQEFLPKFIIVGERGTNVGITSLQVRPCHDEQQAGRYQVFAQIENFQKRPVKVLVELLVNGRSIDEEVRQVSIEPMSDKPGVAGVLFSSPHITEGIVQVRLDIKDLLAVDNQAWAVVTKPRQPRILLVSPGNYFLHKVLREHDPSLAQRGTLSPADYEKAIQSMGAPYLKKYDLIVFDSYSPAQLPPGGCYLLVNAFVPLPGLRVGAVLKGSQLQVIDQDQTHPLMRFVNMEGLNLGQARQVKLPPIAVPLVEARRTPLIAVWSAHNSHYIWINFNIFQSDWPLRLSFPIFMANSVQWCMAKQQRSAGVHRAGELLCLNAPPGVQKVTFVTPTRQKYTVPVDQERRVYFTHTGRVGIYRAHFNQKREDKIAMNLLCTAESHIAPCTNIKIGNKKAPVYRHAITTNREIWQYLALGAFVVLLMEWYVYNRRAS